MSAKGKIPHRIDQDFGLIETLLWTPKSGYWLIEEHLARLTTSAKTLGFICPLAMISTALADVVQTAATTQRIRLVLHATGRIETTALAFAATPPETFWRTCFAHERFKSSQKLLRHKTTLRTLYESELAEAQARFGVDEVIFLNERNEICEGARCNIFVKRDNILLTPALACGLLPGTLRANLLAKGRAREAILHPHDLDGAEFYMGNALRGLIRATLDEQAL